MANKDMDKAMLRSRTLSIFIGILFILILKNKEIDRISNKKKIK